MLEPRYVERTTVRFHVFCYPCSFLHGADMSTLSNVDIRAGGSHPASDLSIQVALPEAKSRQGVSVRYARSPSKHWFVLRASYGRTENAADYILSNDTYCYIARRTVKQTIGGKLRLLHKPLIPNLLFVYSTADEVERYVKHTPTLSFLSYYYNHFAKDCSGNNPPLTVSVCEMENFIRATATMNEHLMVVEPSACHYKGGETVLVTDGVFKGVTGKVARVSGQQRVIINLSNVGLIATAYIPTAFLQKTEK